MATFNLKRNELVASAFEVIGIHRHGESLSAAMLDQGVDQLNLIIREESDSNQKANKDLWALSEDVIQLQAGAYRYNSDDGLAIDINEIVSAWFRDTNGDDSEILLITAEQYESIGDKNETGDPEKAYLKMDKDQSCQELWIWPAPSSVSSSSEVVGTDGENYFCTMGHTAAAVNRPASGNSHGLYWTQGGTSGATWVTDTEYTNGEMIRYIYKRPLADFDDASDNPDMPQGWTRYLQFRLAYDLSHFYGITLEERGLLEREYLKARQMLFPSTQPQITDFHNKDIFF